MRILSIVSSSGGACKTTSVMAFADILALKGYRVLVIDNDSNAHLTMYYGITETNLRKKDYKTVYEFVFERESIRNCVVRPNTDYYTQNNSLKSNIDKEKSSINLYLRPDIVPSNLKIGELYVEACKRYPERISNNLLLDRIKEFPTDEYDFVIIDTNPNLDVPDKLKQVLIASDDVLCTCPLEDKFILSLRQLNTIIKNLQANNYEVSNLCGVFINKYDNDLEIKKAPLLMSMKLKQLCETEDILLFNHLIRNSGEIMNSKVVHNSILNLVPVTHYFLDDGTKEGKLIVHKEKLVSGIGVKTKTDYLKVKGKSKKLVKKQETYLDLSSVAKDYIALVNEYLNLIGIPEEKPLNDQLSDIIRKETR